MVGLRFLLLQVGGNSGDLRIDLAFGRCRLPTVDCMSDEGTVSTRDDQVVIGGLTLISSIAGHHLCGRVRVHRLLLHGGGHLRAACQHVGSLLLAGALQDFDLFSMVLA